MADGFFISMAICSEKFDTGMIFAVIFYTMQASINMKETKTCGGKRVLVVDNDQDFRRYITDCLQAEGISCITASSVSEALEALARNNVSVLLVDWFLDHVAIEVVRAARSSSALMPIIVMSGKSYNVKMDALMADADEFLEKTVGGSALATRVKRWIGRLRAAPDIFLPLQQQDILLLDEVKYRYIRHVVQLVGNNISLAAQKLGVHRQTIYAAMANEEVEEGKADNGAEPSKLSLTTRGVNETNDRE
jgi:two-component system response regulator RegA